MVTRILKGAAFFGALALACARVSMAADGETAASPDEALLRDVGPVLARAYPGADTASLLSRIQERLKWGEKDERLIEAEGLLHWDRGETHLAVPCFKQLSAPRPATMILMAEALEARGERYDAADWRLRAARSLPPGDPRAIAQFGRYLSVRPADGKAELDLASRLETQMRFAEAADLYWKHRELLVKDSGAAMRAADLLAIRGRPADAAALVAELRRTRTADKSLAEYLAGLREVMGDKAGAASIWTETWQADPADTVPLQRALALWETAGPAGEAPLRALLAKALERDPASAGLHYRMAMLMLKAEDRKGAYAQLELALRSAPGDSAILARLPEAIEGDSLIREQAALLEARFAREPASPRLALLAARAYSLAGDRASACQAWAQLAALDSKALLGRRDAFLDLAGCGDPASLRWASMIGSRHLSAGFDRDAARAMIQIALKARDFGNAAGYAVQLASESPADAGAALDAARTLLSEGKEPEARDVLSALADRAANPEAALLIARLHMAAREWAAAIPRLRAARDSFPEAAGLLGECLAEAKDYAGAAGEYEAHFARSGAKESLRAAARLRRLAGDSAREAEDLQALEDQGWAGDEERLRLGLAKAARGDTRGAMALYDSLFRGRGTLPAGEGWALASLQYGTQMAHDGGLDKAIVALGLGLKAAAPGTPGLAEAWMRLGECLAEKKEWREAHAAYASALAADPSSVEAAVEMLNAAKQAGGAKELSDAYHAVYRLDTLHIEANAVLAAGHQAAHEYREAAALYRRVARARPADAQAWENLGNALAMIPDLKAASGPLQTAIDLGAQSDEVYINRARAYRAEGEKDMAASILHFLMKRDASDYLAVLWSAKFAEEDGYFEVASDLFRKSAKLPAPRSSWPELTQARVQVPREAKASARAD